MPLSFVAMPRGAFTGFQMIFLLSLPICAGSGIYAECVSLPHEWSKRPHTAEQTGKKECCRPVEQVPSDRKHSYFLVGGLPFSRFRLFPFSFGSFLFLRIFPEVFVFQSASVFVYLHPAPFSRIASGSHFRSGRKGNSGIWRESKVKPPVFGKNLQPFG